MEKAVFRGPGKGRPFGGFVVNDEVSLKRGLQKELNTAAKHLPFANNSKQDFSRPFRGKRFRDFVRAV